MRKRDQLTLSGRSGEISCNGKFPTMNFEKYFFITGMLRSGTTLLDKILHNHPECYTFSQKKTSLFIKAKEDFNLSGGIHDYHILGNYFDERRITPETFTTFLESYIPPDTAYSSFAEWTLNCPEMPTAKIKCGIKEVLCEEFIPFFLQQGIKCLLILRDPRSVIASMRGGVGQRYTGSPRPLLFELRNWRKSVAFAIRYSSNNNLMTIKYEDLIHDQANILNRISEFLGISIFPEDFSGSTLKDQEGNTWTGNSSFEPKEKISGDYTSFREKLSSDNIRFIENVCFPEMKYIGYTFSNELSAPDTEAILSFAEPTVISRAEFADFDKNSEERKKEITRIEMLSSSVAGEEVVPFFIFRETYETLKTAFAF